MNVTKELDIMKAQLEEGQKKKNAAIAELQKKADTCVKKLGELSAARIKAAESFDAKEGAAANTEMIFYQEEQAKVEKQRDKLLGEKPLTPGQYDKASKDLSFLAAQHVEESKEKVKKLLNEIEEVIENARRDSREISAFVTKLEGEHQANYNGDYRYVPMSSLPEAAFSELIRIKYLFFK